MYLYPLELPQFYKETNFLDVLYFGIGLGVVIAILILVNSSKERLGITDSNFSAPRVLQAGGRALRKLARSMGLDSAQFRMLSFVMKNDEVTEPEQVLHSPALLDRHFKSAYQAIIAGPAGDEVQQKLSALFATRNILESTAAGDGMGINSTRVLPENTPAVLMVREDSYPVRIVSSRDTHLLVENPVNAMGEFIAIDRNTPVTLSFYTKSTNGFSVKSTVSGTLKAPGEGQVLQVVHSDAITRLSLRRFRRRQIRTPVEFNLVRLEPGPGKREPRMVLDKRKETGVLLDISIGGCSIQTASSVSAGLRLRIGFTAAKQRVVALGEVLRTNESRSGTIMHIKFRKIPRQSLNIVNALVFGYLDK
jgi:hypothetical protein